MTMETARTEALTANSQNRSSLARTAGPRPARKRRRAAKPQSTESETSDTKIGSEAETPPMRRSLARAAKASATATKRTKETAGSTRAQSSPAGATKLCQRCGRTMEMRKKWRDVWDEVKYCSKACSKAKLRPLDMEMEQQIVKLLQKRAAASTICPSEVPRFLGLENWRDEMEPARQAVRRLAARGIVEVRQRGQTVDPFSFRGPIRVGRGDNFDAADEISSDHH